MNEKPIPDKNQQVYDVDSGGFLMNPGEWDDTYVKIFASEEGIKELTPLHWKVIRFARSFYKEHGGSPMPPAYSRFSGMSVRKLCTFFPKGFMSIRRLAGLPQPRNC